MTRRTLTRGSHTSTRRQPLSHSHSRHPFSRRPPPPASAGRQRARGCGKRVRECFRRADGGRDGASCRRRRGFAASTQDGRVAGIVQTSHVVDAAA
eukprot:4437011-Pleurochrysis_carterae.AAC.1